MTLFKTAGPILAAALFASVSAKADEPDHYTMSVTGTTVRNVMATTDTLEQCKTAAEAVAKTTPSLPVIAYCIASDGTVYTGEAERESCKYGMTSCFTGFTWMKP